MPTSPTWLEGRSSRQSRKRNEAPTGIPVLRAKGDQRPGGPGAPARAADDDHGALDPVLPVWATWKAWPICSRIRSARSIRADRFASGPNIPRRFGLRKRLAVALVASRPAPPRPMNGAHGGPSRRATRPPTRRPIPARGSRRGDAGSPDRLAGRPSHHRGGALAPGDDHRDAAAMQTAERGGKALARNTERPSAPRAARRSIIRAPPWARIGPSFNISVLFRRNRRARRGARRRARTGRGWRCARPPGRGRAARRARRGARP